MPLHQHVGPTQFTEHSIVTGGSAGDVIRQKQAALDDHLATLMTRYHCTPGGNMWWGNHPDVWPTSMIVKPDHTWILNVVPFRLPPPYGSWTMALCSVPVT
jgi:hypothetical protein